MDGTTIRSILRGGPAARLVPFLLIAWLLPLTACESTGPGIATYTVRDSSGVQIVESTAPAWAPDEAWTVSSEPVLHIGVIDGPEEYQFTIIAGVWQTSDGGFVVADRSGEIRAYDAGGTFRLKFGAQGEGPGEFRALSSAFPYPGDSIAAWDAAARRLSVFDRDGNLSRSVPFDFAPPSRPTGAGIIMVTSGGPSAIFDNGDMIGSPSSAFSAEPGMVITQDAYLIRYSPQGDSLQTYGPFVGREFSVPDPSALGRRPPSPYSRTFVSSPRRSGIYVGEGTSFEIKSLSLEGTLERVIRASHRDLTLTEAHREAFRELERDQLARAVQGAPPGVQIPPPPSPQEIERILAEVEFPETIPPYNQFLVDSEENLWVREYKMQGTSGPEVWSVFAPEGYLLGTVETPERLQVRQIGPDFVLGIWTDELDVGYVRKYALERN